MKKERQSGFYWVKIFHIWTIGRWSQVFNQWQLFPSNNAEEFIDEYNDNELEEIIEIPITPPNK